MSLYNARATQNFCYCCYFCDIVYAVFSWPQTSTNNWPPEKQSNLALASLHATEKSGSVRKRLLIAQDKYVNDSYLQIPSLAPPHQKANQVVVYSGLNVQLQSFVYPEAKWLLAFPWYELWDICTVETFSSKAVVNATSQWVDSCVHQTAQR